MGNLEKHIRSSSKEVHYRFDYRKAKDQFDLSSIRFHKTNYSSNGFTNTSLADIPYKFKHSSLPKLHTFEVNGYKKKLLYKLAQEQEVEKINISDISQGNTFSEKVINIQSEQENKIYLIVLLLIILGLIFLVTLNFLI
ncbi:hypothetical protein [Salibacter halophilus]|uniref:Uncharacterized protein n=1 Tax=Salibacter halophilus TaxID=1803916 RepID=A0A6N6M8M5_9FLAO|nr:hypothetical protein [Salibacter halophilus]KAB1064368.1 hypothetical protein F3059_06605 [Salibacter halophilus]